MKTLEQTIEEIREALLLKRNGEGPESELFDLWGQLLPGVEEDFEEIEE